MNNLAKHIKKICLFVNTVLPMLPLRNTLRPEFGIFSFCQFFSAKLRLRRISAVVTGGGIREILFFCLAILLMKLRVFSRVR